METPFEVRKHGSESRAPPKPFLHESCPHSQCTHTQLLFNVFFSTLSPETQQCLWEAKVKKNGDKGTEG